MILTLSLPLSPSSDEVLVQSSGVDGTMEKKTCLLLELVLGTLHKCFLYDNGSLLSKEHFTALLQPLVDQVSGVSKKNTPSSMCTGSLDFDKCI